MTIRKLGTVSSIVFLAFCSATWAEPLPGTKSLTIDQPLDVFMVDGIDRFALREIAQKKYREMWDRERAGVEVTRFTARDRKRSRALDISG